jgi:hypothetical protein
MSLANAVSLRKKAFSRGECSNRTVKARGTL